MALWLVVGLVRLLSECRRARTPEDGDGRRMELRKKRGEKVEKSPVKSKKPVERTWVGSDLDVDMGRIWVASYGSRVAL